MECRLCLGTDTSIYLSDSLMELVRSCCQLEIKPNDGLPDRICCTCNLKLKSFEDFKNLCVNSDNELRNRLKKSCDLTIVKQELPYYSDNDNNFDTDNDENILNELKNISGPSCSTTELIIDSKDFNIVKNGESLWLGNYVEVEPKINKDETFNEEYEYDNRIFQEIKLYDKHVNKVKYKCRKCFKTFPKEILLQNHKCCPKVTFYQNNEKSCDETEHKYAKYINISEEKSQLLDASSTNTYIGNENLDIQNLGIIKQEKKSKYTTCNICHQLRSTKHLRRHMLRHTQTKNYLCSHCGRGFMETCQLRKHLNVHLKPKLPKLVVQKKKK